MVSDRQDGAATAAPSDKKTGENYFDESGEYLSDADTEQLHWLLDGIDLAVIQKHPQRYYARMS
ncbi:hypothetical protein [Burkholderia glumae]|uniref:hypothetical protein n=1 Tax=Burkholderia glumae TaxID=337 RepID=UPI002150F408|nr:hypothetical protein [Burkholderia glumae]